ncbi:hypothetical protein [Deinococcus yavapaiensis]|uniref:Lipoprotein n=1 Tax=Deinococcus yavapaiensis KR-236 TaxID=694435 RepID=A0A318S5K7_9DEIO|nr:hypothetical protein [Deinococcus yavapaiensis]PYE48949.1 hypothetical protein DES52_12615 [Deinococcus yavapaiensis KR-236]
MRRHLLLVAPLLLASCDQLGALPGTPASVRIAVDTNSLDRDLSGNVVARGVGDDRTVVSYFSFKANSGVQEREVFAGTIGTTVDVCVNDAVTPKLAGVEFTLSKASHLVLLQQAGDSVRFSPDADSTPSSRASCNNIQ